jgi:hypothetical protein
MAPRFYKVHTENSNEELSLKQIMERCPGINRDTLRNRLDRGERSLKALQARAMTRKEIAKKVRKSLRLSGMDMERVTKQPAPAVDTNLERLVPHLNKK